MFRNSAFLQSRLQRSLVVVLLFGLAPWGQAAVWYVDADASGTVADGGSWATAFRTLQEAVDAGAPGATEADPAEIWVAAGVYTGETEPVVSLGDHVHLYGGFAGTEAAREGRDWAANETVVDGEDERRCVLSGFAGSVVDGFTIRGGDTDTRPGAGLLAPAGDLALRNCRFVSNSTRDVGGAASIANAQAIIENCQFEENTGATEGGALFLLDSDVSIVGCVLAGNISNRAGGIRAIGCEVLLRDTDIRGHVLTAAGGQGGGILASETNLRVEGCSFMDNRAYAGAAAHVTQPDRDSGYSFFAVNTRFERNMAAEVGGALLINYVASTVEGCTFENNQAEDGAGIFITSTQLAAVDTDFTRNRAVGDQGGGGIYLQSTALTVDGCRFVENSGYGGGAVYFAQSGSGTFSKTDMLDNAAEATGGAVYAGRANLSFTACRLVGNHAFRGGAIDSSYQFSGTNGVRLVNSVLARNVSTHAAVYLPQWRFEAVNSVIAYNASGQAGAIEGVSRVSLLNSISWGNSAGIGFDTSRTYDLRFSCLEEEYWRGEGLISEDPRFWSPFTGDFRLHADSPCLDAGGAEAESPAVDIDGTARPQGSGIDLGVHEMAELDSDGDGLFDGFEVAYSGTNPAVANSDGAGGNDGADWFQPRVWFVDGDAAKQGQDGRSWGTAYSDLQTAANRAAEQGAGILWVTSGTYRGSGGEVLWLPPNVQVYGGFDGTESLLSNRDPDANLVKIDGEGARRGVVMMGRTTLDGVRVENGYGPSGANVFAAGENWQIIGCTLRDGASVYQGGGLYAAQTSGRILRTRIESNQSSFGAGISGRRSDLVLEETVIQNNTANSHGAAANFDECEVEMNSCRIQGNLGDFGAVLRFGNSDGTLRNTVIHDNESLQNSGVVFVNSGDLALTHCSVVDNRAGLNSGVLVVGTRATLNLTHAILWNATEEITDLNASAINVSHTCVRGGYAGEGNFDARPAFWNIVTGDLRQHPDAPCVNVTGAPVVLEADIDGNARPLDGVVDLGAFETDLADGDGDGLVDGFETTWSGTDPENPNSDNYGLWDGRTWFKRRPWLVNPLATAEVRDGYHWDTAFSTIQEAIDVAAIHGGGDVWVMAGTYTGEGPRVIYVRDNVSVYGGFDGNEWRLSQRQPDANPVILDGERDRQVAHLLGQTRLDGLTIMNGFGIDGGGAYGRHERVDLHNCDFVENRAISRGAGVFINSRTLEIKDCTFVDNTATQSGGGLWTGAFYGRVENSVFTGNRSIREGSAISTHFTGTHFAHCTIAGNEARNGVSAVYSISSGFERMANCILYDNGENIVNALTNETLWVQHSIVQGGYDGIEILNVPPQFLDLAGRDFRLAATSPALDRGAAFFGLPRDILGTSRPQGAGYDLGAYERPVNGFEEEALPVVVVADTRPPETEVADGEPVLEVRFGEDRSDSTERDASPERAVTVQSIHDADLDGDRALSVEELLRVVQLYHGQGVRCGDTTEDGFAPGLGRVACAPHHLDYDPQDWVIGLDELLRAIAFYNGGGPYPCPDAGTEDGWCGGSR